MSTKETERKILKGAMSARAIGQKELAGMMDVNQSTISTAMRRDRIGLGVFTRMLNVMDYDVAVIDRESGEILWTVDASDED